MPRMSVPFFELFFDRSLGAGNPDSQLGIKIKAARRLHGELGDRTVGDGVILHFFTCEPLLVRQNEPTLSKDKQITHNPEGTRDLLAFDQKWRKF